MCSYLFEIVFETDFEQTEATIRIPEFLVYFHQFKFIVITQTFKLFCNSEKLIQISLRSNQFYNLGNLKSFKLGMCQN